MTHPHTRAAASWQLDGFSKWLLAAFLTAHAALWLLVPNTAQKLVIGDRAGDRWNALTELFASPTLDVAMATIFRIGSPGDWIMFAPVFRLGGANGVILQNVALYALSLLLLYRMCLILTPPAIARLAAVAWAILPATIFHPHALVSEGIANPCLIAVAYQLVRLEFADDTRWRDLLLIGLTLAVLCFSRHIYLLLPLAVAAWLLLFRPHGLGAARNAAVPLLGAGALVGLWALISALGQAHYPLGKSVGGLESNLYLRADRMAAMGQVPMPDGYLARKKLDIEASTLEPSEFVKFASTHPLLFAKTAVSDAFNLVANPGIAMLAGRYLGLFDLGEKNHRDLNKWREAREQSGPLGVVKLLWSTSPTGFIFNAIGGLLWVVFLSVAAWGAWLFAIDREQMPALRWLLFGIVGYALVLTSVTAGYTRWDHRSGIEFIFALWFAIGAMNLAAKVGARRTAAPK
jgi:hypothetical protein